MATPRKALALVLCLAGCLLPTTTAFLQAPKQLKSISRGRLSRYANGKQRPGLFTATPSLHRLSMAPSSSPNATASAPAQAPTADSGFDFSPRQDQIKVGEILSSSLPYIMIHSGSTVVIKYGGHAMVNPELSALFAQDIVLLKKIGINPVVVHGGGPQIASMLKRLQIESTFVQGLRVTDADTMEVAEMVLSGPINKGIVAAIKKVGGRAVGISGRDDNLLESSKLLKTVTNPDGQANVLDLGFVGEPRKVNTQIIEDLVQSNIIPVIAPIGVDRATGSSYNINADTAAGAIAGALKASRLLLLTDVPGVLDKDMNLLEGISADNVDDLIADGTITGGMIPKLLTASTAIKNGVGGAVVLDGRVPHAVLLELFTDTGVGTYIGSEGGIRYRIKNEEGGAAAAGGGTQQESGGETAK